MAYSTAAEVRDRFATAEDDGNFATPKVDGAIARADNIINGKLADVYAVPFDDQPDEPPLIGDLSGDLALALILDAIHPPHMGSDGRPATTHEQRVTARLERIAKGEIQLLGADGSKIARLQVSRKQALFQVVGGR